MKRIILIAEKILRLASGDAEGYLYPSQIDLSKTEYQEVFRLLTPYGRELGYRGKGANPIFRINDKGRAFIANGGWSEIERKENVETKRHKEIVEISATNNKYEMWGIICASIVGVAEIIASILLHKGII